MVSYMARDGYYMAYACGVDLTAWDNAQAAIIVGELNAMDWFIGANVTHTKPRTVNINPMSSTHYPKRLTTGVQRGRIMSTHYLQTGILSYAVMGACTTAGGADPYTKSITKKATEIPESFAFHLEKEGTTANRRKDLMGVVPNNLNISVSESDPIARQTYTGQFAFTGAGGNLAQPTPFVQVTNPPLTWYNYKHGTGASEFQYNSGDINVDILGLNIEFGWSRALFGVYDNAGYPTNGLVTPPFTTRITLDCLRIDAGDTDIETISDTDYASYAGDLDFIADFYVGANDYLKFDFQDMYVDPTSFEEMFVSEGDWFDGVRFDLVFKDESSTLAITDKSDLSKIYFEND